MAYGNSAKLWASGTDIESLVRMNYGIVEKDGTDNAYMLRIRKLVDYALPGDGSSDIRATYAIGLRVAAWSNGSADIEIWTDPAPPLGRPGELEHTWTQEAEQIMAALHSKFGSASRGANNSLPQKPKVTLQDVGQTAFRAAWCQYKWECQQSGEVNFTFEDLGKAISMSKQSAKNYYHNEWKPSEGK